MTKVTTPTDALAEKADRIVAELPHGLAREIQAALKRAADLDELAAKCAEDLVLLDKVEAALPRRVAKTAGLSEAVARIDGTSTLLDVLGNALARLADAPEATRVRDHSNVRYGVHLVALQGPLSSAATGPALSLEERLERAEKRIHDQHTILAMTGGMIAGYAESYR